MSEQVYLKLYEIRVYFIVSKKGQINKEYYYCGIYLICFHDNEIKWCVSFSVYDANHVGGLCLVLNTCGLKCP
jgi:hypothetical protein